MIEIVDARDQTGPVHISRPRSASREDLEAQARAIVDDVRLRGDEAVLEYTRRFDGASLDAIAVPPDTVSAARRLVPPDLIEALEAMATRLRAAAERQLLASWTHSDADGFFGEVVRPLDRVGVYVPGGRAAYPSTVMMTAVPARVAGVDGIAVCSPPDARGEVAEPVLAACAVAGIDEVYRIGGAQAIAALAYGTATVRPVDKIVGPGNTYVTAAKRVVAGWVGTDAQAGPSEIVVIADDTADPSAVATDLAAQAEHGPLGSYILITWSPQLPDAVLDALELAVITHPRSEDVANALTEGGQAVLVRDLDQAMRTSNLFAPEHLSLSIADAQAALADVRNAGSVFVGTGSPVSAGDYAGGTNHVLPTGGAARWASGLGSRDFTKRIYVSGFGPSALAGLALHIDALAAAEGLPLHAQAVRARGSSID